jgi:hypothetical protein
MNATLEIDEVFSACTTINDLINSGLESAARSALIELLDWHLQNHVEYTPLVNNFTRILGLYPYLDTRTSRWEDAFVFETFTVDAGEALPVVLHREQSRVLRRLLEGESLALSAPTSFGKSFIIDSFVNLTSPKTVLIIVPTLALADETRRRLIRKFGSEYRVITSVESGDVEGNAIYIFPQERALSYVERIGTIDLLVVDEFYKASASYDRERSAALIRAILAFGPRAKQKYFLAPNIASLSANPFTEGMDFLKIDFNTVVLRSHPMYEAIGKDFHKKAAALLEVLRRRSEKTLVYVGTYSGISEVVSIVLDEMPRIEASMLLDDFEEWLIENYGGGWDLPAIVSRGFGIHNGQLHRPLSQIQVRVFEEDAGIHGLISTSSIIEGVNTCAQNVVLWKNKNGAQKLSDFEYRNIIGRSGRMFRHFIGQVYVLEKPPEETNVQLDLELQDSLLGLPDVQNSEYAFSDKQWSGVESYNRELRKVSGVSFDALRALKLQTSDSSLILRIATDLIENRNHWAGIAYLNSDSPEDWNYTLFKILELGGGVWDTSYTKFVNFIKLYSTNWRVGINELRNSLAEHDLGIEQMFKLERNLSYKFSALLGDLNTIGRALDPEAVDVSSFVFKASNAFLPSVVYGLEEYGLPRMISRKIQNAGLLNLEDSELTLDGAIIELVRLRDEINYRGLPGGLPFDKYILDYFYQGISPRVLSGTSMRPKAGGDFPYGAS